MGKVVRGNLFGAKDITKGTPADPSTGDGLYPEAASITFPTGEKNLAVNTDEMGKSIPDRVCPADVNEQTMSAMFAWTVQGTKLMEFLANVMGTYTYTVDTPVAGANQHVYDLLDIITSLQWKTVAWDTNDEVKALDECVVKSVLISLDTVMKMTVTFMGTDVNDHSGWTNTVTYDSPVECFTFGDSNNYFRLAAFNAATLTSSDDQPIEGIDILIDRGLESQPPTAGTTVISDIIDATDPKVTVTLRYPEKDTGDNKAFLDAYQGQSETTQQYMLEAYFSGSIITGATRYSCLFQFPRLALLEPPVYEDGVTPIKTSAVFSMLEAEAAPTPMSGITLPKITQINAETDLGY